MLKWSAGTLLIAIGVVGVILPLLPGIPFLIVGALLLAGTGRRRRRRSGLSRLERLQLELWRTAAWLVGRFDGRRSPHARTAPYTPRRGG